MLIPASINFGKQSFKCKWLRVQGYKAEQTLKETECRSVLYTESVTQVGVPHEYIKYRESIIEWVSECVRKVTLGSWYMDIIIEQVC